ncbi:hypothetical protein [Pectobacterium brasiliense]|uniref:hypothetical protein n=1 Tax=Pectobacterium brasiliense TaxID=180957 RepID=UPI003D9A1A68
MATIDITTMRGMMPRIVEHLLPESNAKVVESCHFRHGVITPMLDDTDQGKTFTFKPKTIFHYQYNFWFAWSKIVDAIRSPVANDDYGCVYYINDEFPKVTSAQIATGGNGNYPSVFFFRYLPTRSSLAQSRRRLTWKRMIQRLMKRAST